MQNEPKFESNPGSRPLAVTLVALAYLLVGVGGFVMHFPASFRFHSDDIAMEATEAIAAICGVFLLRGRNWARWLAIAWIAFHVVLSAFHSIPELAVHSLFAGIIGWALFAGKSAAYFGPTGKTTRIETF